MVSGEMINSIPGGNDKSTTTSKSGQGKIQPIPGRTGHLDGEVISDTTHDGLQICIENFAHVVNISENIFCGARDTELLKCQGHRTFEVPWTQADHSAMTTVLDSDRSDMSFISAMTLLSIRVRCIITLIIVSSHVMCDYLNSFCTIERFK